MPQLAIDGGAPVRASFLPYGHQDINENDINAVVSVLRGEYLTTGPAVKRFEDKIAAFVGSKHAVAVANGTAALHAACFAADIGPGDEVITTPMTFAASANCALYMGAKPVFADIDPLTYNIDPAQVEKLINHQTKAIVAVDFTGQPADLDAIKSIAHQNNLIFIEDAAHSLGSEYRGSKIGSIADLTTFSFHPVKHISTGEGGMITTDNDEFKNRLAEFRTHGVTRDQGKLTNPDAGDWYYEQQALGYNYRITDIQCALGSSQMDRLSQFVARRRELADMYNRVLKDIPGVITPHQADFARSSWHLYIIQLDLEQLKVGRKEIFAALKAENIGANVHYIPVYYHPYYQKLGYRRGLCPIAEGLYEKIITLPLYPAMQNQDLYDVAAALTKVLNYYHR